MSHTGQASTAAHERGSKEENQQPGNGGTTSPHADITSASVWSAERVPQIVIAATPMTTLPLFSHFLSSLVISYCPTRAS